MKKLFALLLVTVMLVSAFGVALAQSSDPVTVTIWHNRGAGKNGEMLDSSVAEFNETIGKEKGIVVKSLYQGGYDDSKSAIMTALATGDQEIIPEIVVLERASGVPDFAIEGELVNLQPYVDASGLDMNDFQQVLLGFSYYNDELISLPYIRSTPLYYYNKTMFDAAGLTAPKTIEELEADGKALTKKNDAGETTTYGFLLDNDPCWFIANMLWQMDSALFSDDGKHIVCLEDGTLEKALTAWRQWVDDGWCAAPASANAHDTMMDMFFNGNLASFFASSGSLSNVLTNANFEVGVAYLPTWGTPSAPTGGGNIALLKNNPQEQIDAAWEFINFLMTPEQVAKNAAMTGYLPTTKSAAETDTMKKLWAEHPQYKVAFDQLSIGHELPWCGFKADYEDQMYIVCGELIQSQTITAQEAVVKLTEAADEIYAEYGD